MPNVEEEKEVRAQRHDFIKEYYKMAAADLDRHLKGGWQTIVVLAGGVAILTAGHDEKIGLPIAVSMAILAPLWGAATVIDANYLSLRAIGFLANVEAVYFSRDDRRYFNPYMGFHPPFKLLNSLRYLFVLCIGFALLAIGDLVWEKRGHLVSLQALLQAVKSRGPIDVVIWGLPSLVLAWGFFWLSRVHLKRLRDYRDFSRGSPGPGIRTESNIFWLVTFQPLTGEPMPTIETGVQDRIIQELEREEPRALAASRLWLLVAVVTSVIVLAVATEVPR
jgi:hypothetical protein